MTDDLPPDPSPNMTLTLVTMTDSDGRKVIDDQLAIVWFETTDEDPR